MQNNDYVHLPDRNSFRNGSGFAPFCVIHVTRRLNFALSASIVFFISRSHPLRQRSCVSRVFIKSRHSHASRCYILMSDPLPPPQQFFRRNVSAPYLRRYGGAPPRSGNDIKSSQTRCTRQHCDPSSLEPASLVPLVTLLPVIKSAGRPFTDGKWKKFCLDVVTLVLLAQQKLQFKPR